MRKSQYKTILYILVFMVLPISGYHVAHAEKERAYKAPKQEEQVNTASKNNKGPRSDNMSRLPIFSSLFLQDRSSESTDDTNDQGTATAVEPTPIIAPAPEVTPTPAAATTTKTPVANKKQEPVADPPAQQRPVTISEIPKLFVTRTSSNSLYEQNKLNPTATKLFILVSSLLGIGGLVLVTGQPQTVAYRISSFFSFL